MIPSLLKNLCARHTFGRLATTPSSQGISPEAQTALDLLLTGQLDQCEQTLKLQQAHEAADPGAHFLYLVTLHHRLAVLEPEFSDVALTPGVLQVARQIIAHGLAHGDWELALAAITPLPHWLAATAEGRALLSHGLFALRQQMDTQQFLSLLGAWLLSQGDTDAAVLCAKCLRPGTTGSWLCLTATTPLPQYCHAHRLPCLGDSHEPMQVIGSGVTSSQSTFMCKLPEGRVLGHTFLPVSADNHVFLAGCLHNPFKILAGKRPAHLESIALATSTHLLAHVHPGQRHAGEYALLGGHPNFGHWLLNHFSRLMFIDRYPHSDRLRYIVSDTLPPVAWQMLDRAGIESARLHAVGQHSMPTFEHLWVPSMPFGADSQRRLCWLPSALHFVRQRLRLRFDAPRTRKLFITRANAQWRRLANERDIVTALKPFGFEVCDPGQMNLEQQIELAAATRILVTPFGAGANLHMFCATGVPVIELQHPLIAGTMDLLPSSTAVLDQPFKRIIGPVTAGSCQTLDQDYVVSVRSVTETVSDFLQDG